MNPKYKEGDVLYWAGYYYGNPCIFKGTVFKITPYGMTHNYTLTGVEWKVLYADGWRHWDCPDGPGEAYMDCHSDIPECDLYEQEALTHKDLIQAIKEELRSLEKQRKSLCKRLKIVEETK